MTRVLMCGPLSLSGGVANHTKNLIRGLSLLGADIIFFNFSNKNPLNPKGSAITKTYRRTIGLLFEIILHKNKYDLIHIQTSGGIASFISAITGSIASKIVDKKLVITFHHSKTKQFVQKYKKLFGFVLKNTDEMILVSDIQKKMVADVFPQFSSKMIVIPNGYDSNVFYPKNKQECRVILGLPPKKKIILNVSNLIESKGHRYLIEAMNKVLQSRDDVLCFIIGKGHIKNELDALVNKFGLNDSVKLLGWISDEELPIWINGCDLFILPSLAESFGIVQIEAMACGKPIIATYNGGSEEIIISKDYGLLCEPSNPKNLAHKISLALNKKWDYKGIESYAKKYSWYQIANQILDEYKKL